MGKYSIEDCFLSAKKWNGSFLSPKYEKYTDKYDWKCEKQNHPVFQKTYQQVRRGCWCKKCKYDRIAEKNRKYDFSYCCKIAQERNGLCLSSEYINTKTKMQWQCNVCGLKWDATFDSINLQKTWCPRCKGLRVTTEDCIKKAAYWKGEFLETEYKGYEVSMKWKCNNGHIFNKKWKLIANGSWCPFCKSSLGERITTGLFSRIFDAEFSKVRIITSPISNNPLELDGYNPTLKIAFEYQGRQHFTFIKHFYKQTSDFERRKTYDQIKREWCKTNGITLIEIPEFNRLDDLKLITEIIENSLKESKITIPIYTKPNTMGEILISDLTELRNICEEKGGEVLSDAFMGWNSYHCFKCTNGHTWRTLAYLVRDGSWCKKCMLQTAGKKRRKYTIEDAKLLANSLNGLCLSELNTITNSVDLTWFCNKHRIMWNAPISRINRGAWCPICGTEKNSIHRRKYSISFLQKLAEERGGKCLSTAYINTTTKYLWQCSKGHTWEATFSDIRGYGDKKGKHKPTWCPVCAGKAPLTIEEMKIIASEHGGKCLSTKIKGAHTNLKWQCEYGHIFYATPNNIKNGREWCGDKECRTRRMWNTRRNNTQKKKDLQ